MLVGWLDGTPPPPPRARPGTRHHLLREPARHGLVRWCDRCDRLTLHALCDQHRRRAPRDMQSLEPLTFETALDPTRGHRQGAGVNRVIP